VKHWSDFVQNLPSMSDDIRNTEIPWPRHHLLELYLSHSARSSDASTRRKELVIMFHSDKVKQKISQHLAPGEAHLAELKAEELCKLVLSTLAP